MVTDVRASSNNKAGKLDAMSVARGAYGAASFDMAGKFDIVSKLA